MRFAPLTLSCLWLCSLYGVTAPAAHAQSFARHNAENSAQANTAAPAPLRRRAQGTRDTPKLGYGLYAERVATSLGQVSAMVSDAEGSLYVLSRDTGQLVHLMDRGLDGRMDTQRVLSSGFDTPTGLTLAGDYIYVADKSAIWRIDADGRKDSFVPLTNMTAGELRPLLTYENKLLLGLSTDPNTSQVISVDIDSRMATLLTKIPEAPLRNLSYGGGQLWAAAGQNLRPVTLQSNTDMAKAYPLETGAQALAVHLPSETTRLPDNWPAELKDHIIALQGPTSSPPSDRASGGNNIVALPTQFGAPTANLTLLAGGFSSRDGRSAWAAPSAISLDSRGLFFADRLSGNLWRLAYDDRPKPAERKRISPKLPEPPKQKPSLKSGETQAMSGSLLGAGSGLGRASTLEVGSFLKKDYEEKEAAKRAADEAKEAAKAKAKAEAKKALSQAKPEL